MNSLQADPDLHYIAVSDKFTPSKLTNAAKLLIGIREEQGSNLHQYDDSPEGAFLIILTSHNFPINYSQIILPYAVRYWQRL